MPLLKLFSRRRQSDPLEGADRIEARIRHRLANLRSGLEERARALESQSQRQEARARELQAQASELKETMNALNERAAHLDRLDELGQREKTLRSRAAELRAKAKRLEQKDRRLKKRKEALTREIEAFRRRLSKHGGDTAHRGTIFSRYRLHSRQQQSDKSYAFRTRRFENGAWGSVRNYVVECRQDDTVRAFYSNAADAVPEATRPDDAAR